MLATNQAYPKQGKNYPLPGHRPKKGEGKKNNESDTHKANEPKPRGIGGAVYQGRRDT